jgi:hypothetical protein
MLSSEGSEEREEYEIDEGRKNKISEDKTGYGGWKDRVTQSVIAGLEKDKEMHDKMIKYVSETKIYDIDYFKFLMSVKTKSGDKTPDGESWYGADNKEMTDVLKWYKSEILNSDKKEKYEENRNKLGINKMESHSRITKDKIKPRNKKLRESLTDNNGNEIPSYVLEIISKAIEEGSTVGYDYPVGYTWDITFDMGSKSSSDLNPAIRDYIFQDLAFPVRDGWDDSVEINIPFESLLWILNYYEYSYEDDPRLKKKLIEKAVQILIDDFDYSEEEAKRHLKNKEELTFYVDYNLDVDADEEEEKNEEEENEEEIEEAKMCKKNKIGKKLRENNNKKVEVILEFGKGNHSPNLKYGDYHLNLDSNDYYVEPSNITLKFFEDNVLKKKIKTESRGNKLKLIFDEDIEKVTKDKLKDILSSKTNYKVNLDSVKLLNAGIEPYSEISAICSQTTGKYFSDKIEFSHVPIEASVEWSDIGNNDVYGMKITLFAKGIFIIDYDFINDYGEEENDEEIKVEESCSKKINRAKLRKKIEALREEVESDGELNDEIRNVEARINDLARELEISKEIIKVLYNKLTFETPREVDVETDEVINS